MTASPAQPAWIALDVSGTPGSTVALSELLGGAATPFRTLTLTAGQVQIGRARAWRCDRRVRRLQAAAVSPSGAQSSATATVRTPSCSHRFAVTLRPRTAARVGRRLTVTVGDRRQAGRTPARVCLRAGAAPACRRMTAPGRSHLRVNRAGDASVTGSGTGFRVRERLETRSRHAPLRLLATGDSMIQIVDSLLKQRLGPRHAARVTSDARISTGISKPLMLDWVRHARRPAARLRPQATVMFIGANDGFPIGRARCCDGAWVGAYARRVTAMMRAYRRGGAGRVYWLTIPASRDAARKPIYHAVDEAIRRAAAHFAADEVSVVDLVPVFTQSGVFRASIHGRVVRQAD